MKCLHNDLWLSTHDLNCKSATATFCFRFWHMLSLARAKWFSLFGIERWTGVPSLKSACSQFEGEVTRHARPEDEFPQTVSGNWVSGELQQTSPRNRVHISLV